jgi:tetratricopeptide (TPR) repeat protein
MRFRTSINLGGGVRLNVNKRSLGLSVGTKGLRHSVNTSGRRTTTVSIPGTGLSHVSTKGGGKRSTTRGTPRRPSGATTNLASTKPGLFAPKGDKQLYRLAYRKGGVVDSAVISKFEKVAAEQPMLRRAALTLLGIATVDHAPDVALRSLSEVYRSSIDIAADWFLRQYFPNFALSVTIAERVTAPVPFSRDLIGCLLIRLHQQRNEPALVAAVAERLGHSAIARVQQAQAALSRQDYIKAFRLTEHSADTDEMNVLLLALRGAAARDSGHHRDALVILDGALRLPSQAASVRYRALYERAHTYLALHEKEPARADFESILDEDGNYSNVRAILAEL